MTNEQIVSEIRNGYSVTDNMQSLYEKNMPFIKMIIKPFTAYEVLEDLLQEAYIGLWEAVQHYDASENVSFITYASYWIKKAVIRYIENNGTLIRLPSYIRHKILRYKKAVYELEQELGRIPDNKEIADRLSVSVEALTDLVKHTQPIGSLDSTLQEEDDLTLADAIQDDLNIENETIDKIYNIYASGELWGVIERYTNERENIAIREYFINKKPLRQIAKELGMSHEAVRAAKDKGLKKLRLGKARRELLEKFDVIEAGAYKNSLNKFNERNFTSTVEYIAIRKSELKAKANANEL